MVQRTSASPARRRCYLLTTVIANVFFSSLCFFVVFSPENHVNYADRCAHCRRTYYTARQLAIAIFARYVCRSAICYPSPYCCHFVGANVAASSPFDPTGATVLVNAPAGQGISDCLFAYALMCSCCYSGTNNSVYVSNCGRVSATTYFAYAAPHITSILPTSGVSTKGGQVTIRGTGFGKGLVRCFFIRLCVCSPSHVYVCRALRQRPRFCSAAILSLWFQTTTHRSCALVFGIVLFTFSVAVRLCPPSSARSQSQSSLQAKRAHRFLIILLLRLSAVCKDAPTRSLRRLSVRACSFVVSLM